MSLNRGQLRTRCQDIINDSTSNIWDDDFWHNQFNDALADICSRGKIYEKPDTVTLVAGTESYDLQDDFFDANSVMFDYAGVGKIDKRALIRIVDKSLLGRLPDYKVVKPVWYMTGLDSSGNKIISIYPVLNYGFLKPTVDIRYWALDDNLTDDNDSPGFNEIYHPLIIDYALAGAYFKDNQMSNYAATVQRYEKKINELNPKAGLSPFRRGGGDIPGPPPAET